MRAKSIVFLGITFILSLLLYFIISYIGKFNFTYKLVIGSIVYFSITLLSAKFNKTVSNKAFFFIILIPPLFILLYSNIIHYKSALISLPSSLAIVLSCYCGYYFSRTNFYMIPLTLFFGIVFWLIIGEKIIFNRSAYGSFTKEINIKSPRLTFYDSLGNRVVFNSSSKDILLDFWNSGCKPCYKLFPDIENFYKKIDTGKIEIYVVHIPFKNQRIENTYHLLDNYKYEFKKLYSKNDDLLNVLGINFFPTTIILKNGNIVYKGDFKSAVERLSSREIKK